jgi:Predicted signal transduction protein with a C-terminal ATPase domain
MVDTMIRETDKQIIGLLSDQDVEWFMLFNKSTYNSQDIYEKVQRIYRLTGMITKTSDYINSIHIYSEKNDYALGTGGSGELKNYYDDSWYKSYEKEKNKQIYWVNIRKPSDKSGKKDALNFISIYHTYNSPGSRCIGVVVFNIDLSKFGNLVNNVSQKNPDKIFILGNDDTILYSEDKSLINTNAKEAGILKNLQFDLDQKPVIETVSGTKMVFSIVASEYNSWKFISAIPLTQYELKLDYLKKFMLVAIILSILFAIMFSFMISLRLYRPFTEIMSALRREKNPVLPELKENIDEFRYIINSIANTFEYNQKIEEELLHRMQLLENAQTIALQSQITPHFLYNTLDTANWMAIELTGGENNVSFILSSLADLLRLSLETEDRLIPIDLEIRHAQRYIDIQSIRYKDKFDVFWEIEENIVSYKIIKITLQPIIENAIYHGIKPGMVKGKITVKGFLSEDNIIIIVADNGVGIEQQDVERLNGSMNKDYIKDIKGDQHIGLENVNQRIKLIFGEKYGIHMESHKNEGTTIKITIPKVG